MAHFVIQTHGRLQEYVAHEKGYFTDAGLTDYSFSTVALKPTDPVSPSGAYQSYEAGRAASVSCACHWTVNMAAANGHGKLWAACYSLTPAGIYVAQDSAIKGLSYLADVAVDVGYQSGSHYATIQALEPHVGTEIRIVLAHEREPSVAARANDGPILGCTRLAGVLQHVENVRARLAVDGTCQRLRVDDLRGLHCQDRNLPVRRQQVEVAALQAAQNHPGERQRLRLH